MTASEVGVDPDAPRRLSPLAPVVHLVRIAPQMLIALVVGGLGSSGLLLPIVVVGAVLTVVVRYVAWLRFTYAVEDGSLVVESGLLQRNRRVVPLDRVQQVDRQRKVVHQVLGLAILRIDTAGSGAAAEVVLDAVTLTEADRLEARLRSGPAAAPTSATPGAAPAADLLPAEPEREVLSLSLGRLALAGITGAKLLAVFAALGALFGLAEDLRQGVAADAAEDVVRGDARPGAIGVALLVLLAGPVWLGAAAAASMVADGGFRLTRRGDELRVRRGLLDQRQATLLVHRVQVVRVHENPLRRMFGLASVSLQSAGGSGPVEGDATRVTVPLLRRGEVAALLAEVLPQAPAVPDLTPAPAAARRRAWVRRVVPAVVVAVPLAVVLAPGGLVALALPLLAAAHGELAYRALGWVAVDGHVVTRTGAVGREVALVPVAKVQSTRLQASPFQRRVGLATLTVEVAGRGSTPEVPDGEATALARLRHDALTTTAARRDEAGVRRRATAGALAAAPSA